MPRPADPAWEQPITRTVLLNARLRQVLPDNELAPAHHDLALGVRSTLEPARVRQGMGS